MAKKGRTFARYSDQFKQKAVQMYEDGKGSYQTLAHQLRLRSATQLKQWVKKDRNGERFDLRGRASSKDTPFIGRPRTHFKSIEEERDYLKKRNPNLHGEEGL